MGKTKTETDMGKTNRKHTCGAECRALQKFSRGFDPDSPKPRPRRPRHVDRWPNRSKVAGRRLVLEAQAQADLLVAANAALRELERLGRMPSSRRVRPGALLGLKNALHALDALD